MAVRPRIGETENLAELENLNEQTLLEELKVRSSRNLIYTYVGEILVTVNPFKWIDGIYSEAQQAVYCRMADKKKVLPHLFAVADVAFRDMVDSKKGQVCVISGESGAGKTEAAKLFVRQLIFVSNGAESEGLERKLVQVNPLLEAFGNAKTGMNNNSSRFGKFTEVRFTASGMIKGAVMRHYLLEKSRLINQSPNEQNFHIFYHLFAGLAPEDLQKRDLRAPGDHHVVDSNPDALRAIKGREMKEAFAEVMECFDVVGFTREQREDLFSVLAGIIHVVDIEFDGDDAAQIVSQNLSSACNQLGVDETPLELAFTKSVNIIRGEETERPYKLHEAEDCRDATAKALYERLFGWIIEQCNKLLSPQVKAAAKTDTSIGILDIFGFECFDVNSFEQLCINLANEQLQYFFNNHIFEMELAEYAKEGVTGKNITYDDNMPLLDLLLQNKPPGLLSILDEEASFPKASDESMIEKFHAAFTKHRDYERPRGNECLFTLRHYAGKVVYQGGGFLEKNRDNLAVDVVGALRLSENGLVRELFGGDEVPSSKSRAPAAARKRMDRSESKKSMRASMRKARDVLAKKKKVTVAASFKTSLQDLMAQLNAANPHFVRCVKPNVHKLPDNFDDALVLKQLRYTGMLETTRIRREGYAYRPLFQDFIDRYYMLAFQIRSKPPGSKAACQRILDKTGVQGWELGHTKVFLRYFHIDQLNALLAPIGGAAVTLQRVIRGGAARTTFRTKLNAKRALEKEVSGMMQAMVKLGQGARDVVVSLGEEDGRRPKDYWVVKPVEPPIPARDHRFDTMTRKGMQRAASVRWFKEVEKKKGAGQSGAGFASWFHGVITRKESEDLLADKPSGTFLVRVAESRFGYSLTLQFNGRCKHFMVDQDQRGNYVVVGNERTFASLNDVVAFHTRNPVTDDGDLLVYPCQGKGERKDLQELM